MKGGTCRCRHCGKTGSTRLVNGWLHMPPPGWTVIGGAVVCDDKACSAKELVEIRARRAERDKDGP